MARGCEGYSSGGSKKDLILVKQIHFPFFGLHSIGEKGVSGGCSWYMLLIYNIYRGSLWCSG